MVPRVQLPLATSSASEPEPDLSLTELPTHGHPTTAALVIEAVVHTDPGPTGYRLVRRQPWEQPLSVPVGEGITVDLASLLGR